MTAIYRHIIRQHSQTLQPVPSGAKAALCPLRGIRGVFWDVYGTMFISGSGEVGTDSVRQRADPWSAAIRAVGLDCQLSGEEGVQRLHETIRTHHERLHAERVQHPEVDIVAVWCDLLGQLRDRNVLTGSADGPVDAARLAVEFESRANPVWPMPNLTTCLAAIGRAGMLLGIISNAQFFTIELFPALLGRTAKSVGFDPDLQYYSYRYHRAKPGAFLYQRARADLSARGVGAEQILYVGNDMLNDVLPARQCGFRTALFAGDARSLRRREGDPRVRGLAPDLVLTDLGQLAECLRPPVV